MRKLGMCTFAVLVSLLSGAAWSTALAQAPDELLAAERAGHAAANARDVEGMATHWTEGTVMDYVVAGSTPLVGKEMLTGFFTSLFQAFPDWHVTQTRELAFGNVVVTECVSTGTQRGVWSGIPVTGQSFQTSHMDIWEYEGTKIKKLTVYDDAVSMMIQLGLMPAPSLPPLVAAFTLPEPVRSSLSPVDGMKAATEVWNSHDAGAWSKWIAQDGDYFYNTLGVPLNREALAAMQEFYFQAFPDTRAEITRIIDLGDGWSVSEYVFTGTNTGPFFGLPATGRPCTIRVATVNRYVDGQISYFHVYMDNLTMFTNLGLVPSAGTPTAVLPSGWGRIKSTFR